MRTVFRCDSSWYASEKFIRERRRSSVCTSAFAHEIQAYPELLLLLLETRKLLLLVRARLVVPLELAHLVLVLARLVHKLVVELLEQRDRNELVLAVLGNLSVIASANGVIMGWPVTHLELRGTTMLDRRS